MRILLGLLAAVLTAMLGILTVITSMMAARGELAIVLIWTVLVAVTGVAIWFCCDAIYE